MNNGFKEWERLAVRGQEKSPLSNATDTHIMGGKAPMVLEAIPKNRGQYKKCIEYRGQLARLNSPEDIEGLKSMLKAAGIACTGLDVEVDHVLKAMYAHGTRKFLGYLPAEIATSIAANENQTLKACREEGKANLTIGVTNGDTKESFLCFTSYGIPQSNLKEKERFENLRFEARSTKDQLAKWITKFQEMFPRPQPNSTDGVTGRKKINFISHEAYRLRNYAKHFATDIWQTSFGLEDIPRARMLLKMTQQLLEGSQFRRKGLNFRLKPELLKSMIPRTHKDSIGQVLLRPVASKIIKSIMGKRRKRRLMEENRLLTARVYAGEKMAVYRIMPHLVNGDQIFQHQFLVINGDETFVTNHHYKHFINCLPDAAEDSPDDRACYMTTRPRDNNHHCSNVIFTDAQHEKDLLPCLADAPEKFTSGFTRACPRRFEEACITITEPQKVTYTCLAGIRTYTLEQPGTFCGSYCSITSKEGRILEEIRADTPTEKLEPIGLTFSFLKKVRKTLDHYELPMATLLLGSIGTIGALTTCAVGIWARCYGRGALANVLREVNADDNSSDEDDDDEGSKDKGCWQGCLSSSSKKKSKSRKMRMSKLESSKKDDKKEETSPMLVPKSRDQMATIVEILPLDTVAQDEEINGVNEMSTIMVGSFRRPLLFSDGLQTTRLPVGMALRIQQIPRMELQQRLQTLPPIQAPSSST